MARPLVGGQVVVDEVDDRLLAVGLEQDLDRGGASREDVAVRDTLGEDDPVGRLYGYEAAAHRRAPDVDREGAAWLWAQARPRADPLEQQGRLDKIGEDFLRRRCDPDGCCQRR
jgi:hypothetical protein